MDNGTTCVGSFLGSEPLFFWFADVFLPISLSNNDSEAVVEEEVVYDRPRGRKTKVMTDSAS